MKRAIGFAALGLGTIGLAGCLAGLVAVWVLRDAVLRSSPETLDAADGALMLLEEKAKRADELVKLIRGTVEPITSKILQLGDKSDRTPEEEKELKRIEEELAGRLDQVGAMAEAAETAAALLNKTARLTKSLRTPAIRRDASPPPDEDARDRAESLSRLTKRLRELRESLAKLRDDKGARKEIVANVVRISRELDDASRAIDARLQEVSRAAAEWRAEVAELRTAVPAWANRAAVIGSVVLVWLGLGQFTLARWGWGCIRERRLA